MRNIFTTPPTRARSRVRLSKSSPVHIRGRTSLCMIIRWVKMKEPTGGKGRQEQYRIDWPTGSSEIGHSAFILVHDPNWHHARHHHARPHNSVVFFLNQSHTGTNDFCDSCSSTCMCRCGRMPGSTRRPSRPTWRKRRDSRSTSSDSWPGATKLRFRRLLCVSLVERNHATRPHAPPPPPHTASYSVQFVNRKSSSIEALNIPLFSWRVLLCFLF